MKKITFSCSKRTMLLITVLIVFFFEFLGSLGIVSITNNSSEYNVIAIAADLAGYDWKDTILKTHYYGYTSSILFAIIFLLEPVVENAYLLLHGLLLVNILINVICAILLFEIICKIIDENSWIKNYVTVSLITIASSLLISSQVLTKTVTNENFLILCFYLTIYLIICGNGLKDKKKIYLNTFFIALINVLAYATNGRAIILIAITILMFVIPKFCHREPSVTPIIYIIFLLGLLACSIFIKKYFVGTYFYTPSDGISSLKNNDIGGMLSRALSLINLQGIKLYLKLVIGWGLYFIISTYGMGIISVISCIELLYKRVHKKEKVSDSLLITASFSILFLVFVTILGIFFYRDSFFAMYYDPTDPLNDGRVDKLVYGRYISTIKPITISLGLIYLIYIEKENKSHKYLLYLLCYFVFGYLFIAYIEKVMIGKTYAAVDIPEFAIFLKNFQENYKFGIIQQGIFNKIILLFLAVFVLLLILNYLGKKRSMISAIIILNIIIGIIYNHQLIYPRSEYYQSLTNDKYVYYINDLINDDGFDKKILVITNDNGYLYQFNMPKAKVVASDQLNDLELNDYNLFIILYSNEIDIESLANKLDQYPDVRILMDSDFDEKSYYLPDRKIKIYNLKDN